MAVDIAAGSGDTVEATTAGATKTLDPTAAYTLTNLAKNVSGADNAVEVFVGFNGVTPSQDYAAQAGKIVLKSGTSGTIGPGTSSITLRTASGNVAVNVDGGRTFR